MSASTIDLMFNFLKQNKGRFSKRAREREFAALTDEEVTRFERVYQNLFVDAE